MASVARMRVPFRRVLALDAGSRCLKLTWVESIFSRLRILRERSIDLQDEGLTSTTELEGHFQALLKEFGHPPVAFALPQHLATSQLIDLPRVSEAEARKLIEDETVKLGGVSESAIIYDSVRLPPSSAERQRHWVTLCQEGEIRSQLRRLDLEKADLCEVTTAANALLNAYLAIHPDADKTVLVHAGAEHTVAVILVSGHGVFTGSFALGGDAFTRAIARQLNCSLEAAEGFKRTHDVFMGEDALPDFQPVAEGWIEELKRLLADWFDSAAARGMSLASFTVVAGGGALMQPGWFSYLKENSGLSFTRWPVGGGENTDSPTAGFEVAYGTALQALGRSVQPVSLLPMEHRAAAQRRRFRQWMELANAVVLLAVGAVLLLGIGQKWRLVQGKQTLLTQMQAATEHLRKHDLLTAELLTEYGQLRPLLERQRYTLDTIKTLALLQESRSNRSFWYVLFADQESYFNEPVLPLLTNATAQPPAVSETNQPVAVLTNLLAPLNPPPAKPGFIAELCVPGDADAARNTFSQLVSELKQHPLFSRVDSLAGDLRRNLADPRLVLPERHFALALELADAGLQRPTTAKRRMTVTPTNLTSRAATRGPKLESKLADTPKPWQGP